MGSWLLLVLTVLIDWLHIMTKVIPSGDSIDLVGLASVTTAPITLYWAGSDGVVDSISSWLDPSIATNAKLYWLLKQIDRGLPLNPVT